MRGPEGKFQDTVTKWLKAKGCRVVKNDPTSGRQKGIPDLLFLKEGFWGMLEIKASKNAKKRPGQEDWVKWASENSYGAFCYPENWAQIRKDLEEIL